MACPTIYGGHKYNVHICYADYPRFPEEDVFRVT